MSYRHVRALCHRDTWLMAVGEFTRRAELVLMDLRGLQARNLGCRQEIEFLFDSVPAQRIVFLVDDRDPEALDALLAACSPNVHERAAELSLYVAGGDHFESADLLSLVALIAWRMQQAAAS
jgi:hypothetical protein